jgi:hypothetical protein
VEFCSAGASYDLDDVGTQGVSLSRNIRVSIKANPEFWGFSGVLISGWATYSNGYYDYFDGFDEDHQSTKVCNSVTYGPFLNEQRPDVFYRSVYDPDTGLTSHYGSDGSLESSGIGRGGAEVYLVNRAKSLVKSVSADNKSCLSSDPTQSFRRFPENFGWGNKINFNTKIFKNLSGAWRLTSLENCHAASNLYDPPGYLVDCSGNEKQNISSQENRYGYYEPSRVRASGSSSYYKYSSGCYPDGAVAGRYAGYFPDSSSIFRSNASSPFVQARLSYGSLDNPIAASGLRNGMTIGIKNDVSGIVNNVYVIFDVVHSSTYTSVKFVGTSTGNISSALPTGDFSLNVGKSGHWVAFDTYDPQTCCGLSAYGISDTNKQFGNENNYHTDFRRVFNNPKNLLQSNRDRNWRYNYHLFDPIAYITGVSSTSGRLDFTYVSTSGGYGVLKNVSGIIVASGSGYPAFDKELSYYGNFFETDKYDALMRLDQAINRGKSNNATCYSKHATLEVFPDCITQYDKYNDCDNVEQYITNQVPRLAFVYRGCDFNDDCSFDSSGLPLGGWKNQGGVPTGINDLKRQLAGQEIHMFINLADAWGGRKALNPCRCDCNGSIPGYAEPDHVTIRSPITFPSFPNFDLNPTIYGCQDPRYQITHKRLELGGSIPSTGICDAFPTSSNACLPKQPYVTYGYIMNLCGKQSKNRRDVISEAFAKLHQDKTYTNANPTGNITEPMYWNIVAPSALPFGGRLWSSGTTARDDSGGTFIQVAGSGYGFWGVSDTNKQVVAPYFCTQQGRSICCESTGTFVDFSLSGTLSRVLGTSNGWPTSSTPFLIEFEVEDTCGGCVSTRMNPTSLNLEIQGLSTDFVWQQSTTRYGHNYCTYGTSTSTAKAKVEKPGFTCSSGFDTSICGTGDNFGAIYGNYYTGNTCSCVNGLNVTLSPVLASGTNDVIIGWTSNSIGGAAGLTELSGCNDLTSAFLDQTYNRGEGFGYTPSQGCGYRVFAQFDLACDGMHGFLAKPYAPDIYYTSDPISTLWSNITNCSHHYPARVGTNGDLDLKTTLYLVTEQNVDIFKKLTDKGLKEKNLESSCITLSDFTSVNNPFGICPGEKVYTYGCNLGSVFYGCTASGGYGPTEYLQCTGNSLCNTCPTGSASGEVTCSCGAAIGYEGNLTRRVPANYQLNECFCECKDPSLIAEYTLTSTGLVLVSGASAACAEVYWVSTDKTGMVLINCVPPQPYLGKKLFTNVGSTDWYDWSHGVNGVVSGVKYDLNYPFLNTEECNNLRRYPFTSLTSFGNSATRIDCTSSDCAFDNNVYSKTCGDPIYSSGTFNGVRVRKKKCHPEVAIVNKIECLGNSYKLYISREYHEHDRTWEEVLTVGDSTICSPVNAGAYLYNYGSGVSGCQQINYALLADTVTPASDSPCSIHPSSGTYVNQDYQYNLSSFPSGSRIWNYFNLFYSSSYLPTVSNGRLIASMSRTSGIFSCSGTPLPIINSSTIFTTGEYNTPVGFNGIFATNKKHSCVQDSTVCGGELWCNKLFFPRHSYKTGTRIAPFGSPSICTRTNEFKNAFNLDGYEEGGSTIDGGKTLLDEQRLRFFDWCNDSLIQESLQDIGIDDTYIIVEDYLPLIGVVHPGWRFTSDTKSCTFGGTGCIDILPTHSNNSILAGVHQPKTFADNGFESMGYYLDKFGASYANSGLVRASGSDQCLFNPFKILIDVECSLNRIARRDFPSDSPTYLHGVQSWSPGACLGMLGDPPCSCGDTNCASASIMKQGECVGFQLTSYDATLASGTYWYCPSGASCSGCSLNGCVEQNGQYIQLGTPVGKYFHPSVLESFTPVGVLSSTPQICYCSSGSGTTSGVYTYATAVPSGQVWKKNTCDGKLYQVSTSGLTYVRRFTCTSNQYLAKGPAQAASANQGSQCQCESNIADGICDSQYRCIDFTSCSCQPVGIASQLVPTISTMGTGGSGIWWSTDCGCEGTPKAARECSQDSLIEWEITES